ncbi:MAG: alpha-2-macroglobulin [Spirochaetales bacterium]|nr:alpha-2-macroglobulin [Spirochaetales bacterium]
MSDTEKNKRKKINLSLVFGTWTPPPYIRFLSNGVSRAFGAAGKFLVRNRKAGFGIAAALAFLAAGFFAFSLWQSRQPKLMEISCEVDGPDTRIDWDDPVPAVYLSFSGSAVPAGEEGNTVEDGITLTPDLPGVWTWVSDSMLSFRPDQDWPVGQTFKVEFAKNYFPDHFKISRTVEFATEEFRISVRDCEFHIDPENAEVKRVLATVSANWPLDPETVEKNIVIKPDMKADSGTLANREYRASVSYDKDRLNAYIVSEPVGMPVDSVTMTVSAKKGIASSFGGNKTAEDSQASTTIPGMVGFMEIYSIETALVKTPEERYRRVIVLSGNGAVSAEEIAKRTRAWILPVDRPDLPGIKGEKNSSWGMIDLVTQSVLDVSEPLELVPQPNALENNEVNSFSFEAPAGRHVFVRVDDGLEFYGSYRQKGERKSLFRVEEFPREIRILSEGSIVPMTGSKRLALYSRGVGGVKFNIGRVRPDDINHLISQSNGDFNNFSFDNYNFNEYNITEQYAEKTTVAPAEAGAPSWFSFDFSRYLSSIPSKNLRYGLFVFSAEGDTERTRRFKDRRLILVSDLGFYVKKNYDGTNTVFVQSIGSGEAVSGAEVSVVGLNGNALLTANTGASGRVEFADVSGFQREKQPVAWVVRKGEDLSFMPYAAGGRSLDLSNFDTGGVMGATDPKKINAFLFSDRSIYRPGDSMHIGMILKSGDWSVNLERTPLVCAVVNPNGAEVFTKNLSASASGFQEIEWKTEDWAPTGEYTVSLYHLVDESKRKLAFLGSETVKVEEFLPDTLNIRASLAPSAAAGWIKPGAIEGRVTLRNLFGNAAAGNDVQASVSLRPGAQSFPAWKEYRFSDPWDDGKVYTESLGLIETDADGTCSFPIDLAKFEKATYRMTFFAEGFEKESGRSVRTEESVWISPLEYLVGWKADGDLGYINAESERTLSLIAVGPDAKALAVKGLTANIAEIKYISMLVKQPNGEYKYQSVKKSEPVESFPVEIAADGLSWAIPTSRQGDFELTLSGVDGLEYAKIAWSVIGGKNIQRSLDRTAELDVKLDRADYRNGDYVRLFIKAPYAGSGLITIERDRVYTHAWFSSKGNSTVQSILVPEGIEGNAYVTVTWARSISSDEIFMSPLCYASVPFSVSRDKRTNRITLGLPETMRPGEDLKIDYSTSSTGKIAIMAVDEGILQVGRHKTPDPLSFFFRKRALEVGTQQIMDLVLPEFNILRTIGAVGGDAMAEELGRNLNPFKRRKNVPVAYWSGIVDSGPETRSLVYRVPDWFNGTVRVMAVAVSGDTIGSAEQKLTVKAPFVVVPNMPVMAAPGDEFGVSVTVTNTVDGSGSGAKVRLTARPESGLAVAGETSFDLAIPEGGDETVSFRVKALDVCGNAEIVFTASGAGETSSAAASLSVRPAVPYRTSVITGVVRGGTERVKLERRVRDEFAVRDASVSYLPTGLAKGLWFYLENYPYMCSEQIASATWPFLYPNLVKELGLNPEEARSKIDAAVSVLQSRLREDGTIGVWTSESATELYLNNYCTLFLIDARDHGYYVSDTLYNAALRGVAQVANSSDTGWYALANRSFACYLLARSGTIATPYIEKLRKDMKADKDAAEGYAGLFLAGTSAILRQDLEAGRLLSAVKKELRNPEDSLYADSLCYRSVYLDITARHFPARLKDIGPELLEAIAADLSHKQASSLSANHALMAIESYLDRMPSAENGSATVDWLDADKARSSLELAGDILRSAAYPPNAAELEIENRGKQPLFYQATTAGFDETLPSSEVKEGIEILREFVDAKGAKLTSIRTGDEVRVKISLRTTNGKTVRDVAVVDLLPAGFEPDIASVRQPSLSSTWKPDYTDIREDRVVFYGTVEGGLKTLVYSVRAVNPGKFAVPPLFAEAMYDRSVTAYKSQPPIEISAR